MGKIDKPDADQVPSRDSSMEDGPAPAASVRARRKCLMCNRRFDSEGSHNRICRRCKQSQTYRSA